jgi:hypothetical protein
VAAPKTIKTVAFTVTLRVPVEQSTRIVADYVRHKLGDLKPRVTPIKEA